MNGLCEIWRTLRDIERDGGTATDLVEVELIVIPNDISYPVWATDFVFEYNSWGQKHRVELDSIRWSENVDKS